MFFQLYVNQDREKTKAIVQRAERAGCTALFITCDAPQVSTRVAPILPGDYGAHG